jgi:Xaa-Pro aminopeptidase
VKNFLKNADAILYRKNEKYPGIFVSSQEDILKAITGLEASDGAVVVSSEKSALFVDSRYTFAAKLQTDSNKFEILNLKNNEIVDWIKKNLSEKSNIAFDPQYYSHEEVDFFAAQLKNYCFTQINLKEVLNIPPEKFDLNIYCIDRESDRISCVSETIARNNLDAYLICDPCSIAWLLNIRDLNRKYTPVVLGYLLLTNAGEEILYLDDRYDSPHDFKFEKDLQSDLLKFEKVGIDKSQTPFHLRHPNFIDLKNPCIFPKSVKNKAEISDIKSAAQKDSLAIINFLRWFYANTEKIRESDVVEKLLYFRKQQDGFIGESFKTIAAADENAAIVHYSPSSQTDKYIDNILLIDSGGQYKHGTTDITRTISRREPTSEQKLFYTLVLKGHIALAGAKFPVGTPGAQLDPLTRQFLWQHGVDYNHSTGHGIGYMSHVHEGPVSISRSSNVPLQAGMIISDEPGYYPENCFGIRLENMMSVVEDEREGYLSFETLSLVPFDQKFIRRDLLTEFEKNWLEEYDQKIAHIFPGARSLSTMYKEALQNR